MAARSGWRLGRVLAALAALALLGCAARRTPGEALALAPVPAAALPGFADDLDAGSLGQAVARTRSAWRTRGDGATAAAADRLLAVLAAAPAGEARRRAVAAAFRVREVRGSTLMTSYYEPELRARRTRDRRFRWPIHARPPDLVTAQAKQLDPSCHCRPAAVGRRAGGRVVPYHTRGEIYAGALDGRGLELGWTDDLLGLFLLQVQGSGRMRLPDGRVLALRHDGTNGRPYRSLGALLIERGMLTREEATLPGIRRVVRTLPEGEQVALLSENPRYGFFALGDGAGPVGSLGVPLTPGRSVAADPAVLPPGSLVWIDMPSVRRFAVVQDTGAAITGAHIDLFAGAGAAAEDFAGTMRDRGRVYLLEPR